MTVAGGSVGNVSLLAATVPVVVAAGMAGIGWIIRSAVASINRRFEMLEASFTRVTGDLAAEHAALSEWVSGVDRRLVRVESWKELVTLPDMQGHARRVSDRVFREQQARDDQEGE